MTAEPRRWEFWIDRGGTFTDCLGRDPATGRLHVTKLLSSDRAPLEAIRTILGLEPDEPIPPCDVRMGTTLATNALLERKGTPALLVITRGFGDLLEIGTQARPFIFELDIQKPARLYRAVLEVDSRADSEGNVVSRLDRASCRRELEKFRALGLESAAVVILHSYRNPDLEGEIGALAEQAGFRHVGLSSQLASEIGFLARGDTAMIDAYLTPLLRRYMKSLLAELPESSLRIMQSSGGLVDALRFGGTGAILSGPAGGVVACASIAKELELEQVIGFDMGGTSTDVSRYAGRYERVYESEVAGVRLRAPMMNIVTVAAGGGSLCRYDGHSLSVGPESAGADPGPLCYGNSAASELTVTDMNLILGRLQPDRFPFRLHATRSAQALQRLATEVEGENAVCERVAEGFFHIANNNMAEAIRKVSVARGFDVRDHALIVFGGAGGQHACALAERLGIRTVVFHPYSGVLSAYGIGLSELVWHGEADAGRVALDEPAVRALEPVLSELERTGRRVLAAERADKQLVDGLWRVDLRYAGTETSLTQDYADATELARAFHAEHERVFGYARPGHPIELVQARVEVVARQRSEARSLAAEVSAEKLAPAEPLRLSRLWHDGRWLLDVPVYLREALLLGHELRGPAIVLESTGTIVVDPGFSLSVEKDAILIVRAAEAATGVARAETSRAAAQDESRPDPILLSIMANLYMSIAEQMGEVLRRTALSTNIRERLDFSCAVFDRDGGLVANAPHIPVHLGAMGESVQAVLRAHEEIVPGDVFATNDPSQGGSHLPDITVVTPVHDAAGNLLFFTASRGHHADIGGTTPGSMPAFSTRLDEEGIVLRAIRIARRGHFERADLVKRLGSGPYPARRPLDNVADIEAQIAANHLGRDLLLDLVEHYGLSLTSRYMQHVQDDAARKVAEQIAKIRDGEHHFEDALDDGTPIKVCLRVSGSTMDIDFSGTGHELESNLNAPRAVTMAAVIYFLRTLVGAPIPLNSGCLRPVRVIIPQGCLLAPSAGRAVAGGNVETSQRIVDVLLGAAGSAAASQGTMNNLTFGDATFGYYETIAGGAGAGPDFHGASAVHTHMTNTRITDPEILETRYPVRLIEFSIRRGSGGQGHRSGGDGVCREVEFLRPVSVSLLSERRVRAPFGLSGGGAGAVGKNLLDGRDIGGKAALQVGAGQRLRVETPGGGGFGKL